ncbi:hyaluronan/mRNA binding family domain-containing protein [Rhizoctonia solani AG-1 IA]|uniref:Hyaluronan/mRNA binding family domain-containing protein n=1 Tax=Thanatephorus cucumeris (strain AG1-IA) TaxID=983506 RepID=L8WBR5_THACA|nr:hyaluronan/mRNA binding family domain-containing protein [Rhizoctonia solani AG-1 IA]
MLQLTPETNGVAKPTDGEEQGERPQKEEEEEDNTMTLTEYLAKKKASEAVPGKPQGRAANEGELFCRKGQGHTQSSCQEGRESTHRYRCTICSH